MRFNFILDTGDTNLADEALKVEAEKLIKYFLAALTVSEQDLWVNLSPYEKDRIIPEAFGVTEMGRDLLGTGLYPQTINSVTDVSRARDGPKILGQGLRRGPKQIWQREYSGQYLQ